MSIRRPGSPTCCAALPIIPPGGCTSCCPGTGTRRRSGTPSPRKIPRCRSCRLHAVSPRPRPDAYDLVGKRLDRADPLHVRRARMSGAPGYLQLYKSGSLAPRDEIAVRPPGLGIEHCARVLCLGLDNRPRGRGGDLLVRGEETGQRARRAKAMGILDLAYSNLAIRLQQVVVRKAVRRVAGKSGDGKKRRARRRGSVVARFGGIRGGQECLTEADYIHWQHGRMQDYDWPQRVEIAIADE